MEEVKVDRHINIKGFVCPITFVKSKLAIEEMEEGEVLEILLDYELATKSIPKSMEEHGHEVLLVERVNETDWLLRIKKGKD